MTLTRHEAGESKEMEGLRAHAEALLTLSSSPAPSTTGGRGTGTQPSSAAARRAMAAAEGVFECKTCSKRFPSFQALGGHRTGHTRLQARMLIGDPAAAERDRAARVHECAVCGLEFSMGQALGGHMRRHRGEGPPPAAHDDDPAQPDRDMPDLNLPPLDDGGGGSGSGDCQGPRQSGDGRGSEPQLLNLLV